MKEKAGKIGSEHSIVHSGVAGLFQLCVSELQYANVHM